MKTPGGLVCSRHLRTSLPAKLSISRAMASRQSYASMVKMNGQAQARESDDKTTNSRHGKDISASSSSSPSRSNSQNQGRNPQSKSSGAYTASEYIRQPQHIPNTRANDRSPSPNGDVEKHYVLTLLTDKPLHDYMTSLRNKYFPPEINKLDAHITLFHALPGSKLGQIIRDIEDVCSRQQGFPIVAEEVSSPRLINVLVNASSPRFAIEGVQKQLRTRWEAWLSHQDNRGLKPHWTVLNKVPDKSEVQKKLDQIKDEFKQTEGEVRGLVLWRYDRGHWKDRKVFEFGQGNHRQEER